MQNFVTQFGQTIRNQNAFYLPVGDGKVSFIDVRDIAAVSVRALTSDNQQHIGKAYTITGQEAISYGQAAEILSKEVGKRISYVDMSEENARKGMKENGMDDWLIDAIMEFYSIIKAGRASQTTNVVEQITGRKPYLLVNSPRIMQDLSNNNIQYYLMSFNGPISAWAH